MYIKRTCAIHYTKWVTNGKVNKFYTLNVVYIARWTKLLLLFLFLFAYFYLVPADKRILASIIIHEAILRLFFPFFHPRPRIQQYTQYTQHLFLFFCTLNFINFILLFVYLFFPVWKLKATNHDRSFTLTVLVKRSPPKKNSRWNCLLR